MELKAHADQFLQDYAGTSLRWTSPPNGPSALATHHLLFGSGESAVEIAVASCQSHPLAADVRRLWTLRQANRAAPLVLVVLHPADGGAVSANLCGFARAPSVATGLDVDQAARICAAALEEHDRHGAARTLGRAFTALRDELRTGVINSGLFATHELRVGVPRRSGWAAACAESTALLGLSGLELISALGYQTQAEGSGAILLKDAGGPRAIAVLLDAGETFDRPGQRFGAVSPVMHGLHRAGKESLPWLVVLRGSAVRLYPVNPDVGVGRKGWAETYIELDLALVTDEDSGLLPLLFSPSALAPAGSVNDILASSRSFAADLGARLRKRIYRDVVPLLAVAVARHMQANTEDALTRAYHRTLVILFRLLFVAYAEDRGLLPYGRNSRYDRHALKTLARDFAAEPEQRFDPEATGLWDRMARLWAAFDEGNSGWEVPAYNGGLFASPAAGHAEGESLSELRLTDAEFGPALLALVVDDCASGVRGPVDFRTLSVREFGTIYEGLLESSLSRATADLAVDKAGSYIPSVGQADVEVEAGSVYFHNRSGQRKSTGSYFTKSIAVEHLLDNALEPALRRHLARVEALLDADDGPAAAEAFFDFRVADLAMGSGHFLVAAIDRMEARLSAFLAERPLAAVHEELHRLADRAREALGDHAAGSEIELSALLRRQIALRCIYGLDVNPLAVELARLAVWIHTFVPGLPVSTLSRGLRQGNSLTGIASVAEAVAILDPAIAGGQHNLLHREIEAALATASERLLAGARTAEATRHESRDAALAYDKALSAGATAKALFDAATGYRLGLIETPLDADAALVAGSDPVLREQLAGLQASHFPYLYPEVFSRPNPGFDVLLGNPPWEEATVEEVKFWALRFPGLRSLSSPEKTRLIDRMRDERPDLVLGFDVEVARAEQLRKSLTSGAFPGMGTGDPDLYKAFVWRFWVLCRSGGRIGAVLPRSVFAAKGSAAWRRAVLPHAQVQIVLTRNKEEWLFTDVNPGYSICLVSIEKDSSPARVSLRGTYDNPDDFVLGVRGKATALSVERLAGADPWLCVPAIENEAGSLLFDLLLEHPSLGDQSRSDFRVVPTSELHATKDGKIYFTGNEADHHPVFNHLNVGHFRFESGAGAFNYAEFDRVVKDLEHRRQRLCKRVGSPVASMPRAWFESYDNLPALGPRIAIRDVVHAGNRRKIWAALVPARTLLTNKAPYLIFPMGNTEKQAYLLGILCSSVADWYGHLRVVLNLNYFILNALPVPVFDDSDPLCRRVARLAATLAAPGGSRESWGSWVDLALPETEYDTLDDLRDELDSIATLLYNVPDDLLELIFDGVNSTRPSLQRIGQSRLSLMSQHRLT